MTTNISVSEHPEVNISKFLALIGQPARIQILMVIGHQDTCVCHLEAVLGMRQASISQHLMVLRHAGLVTSHREGRNIFYCLAQPEVIDFLVQAARLAGGNPEKLRSLAARPIVNCPCPQCNPGLDPNLSCPNLRSVIPS